MDDRKRKNYTLYLIIYNKEIEILKGSLEEIDDFTTYFMTDESIFKRISSDININYSFVIKSSKGNLYSVLYYPYRPLLFENNINDIMSKLKSLPKNIVFNYVITKTKAIEYSNAENSNNIPIVRLYNAMKSGREYYSELDNYVKSNYKSLRDICTSLLNKNDLEKMYHKLETDKKDKISKLCEIISKRIEEIIENFSQDFNYVDNKEMSELDTESFAYSIINNPLMTYEEKMNELDMLFNDKDKVNSFIKEYNHKIN